MAPHNTHSSAVTSHSTQASSKSAASSGIEPKGLLERIVASKSFEYLFSSLILVNLLTMAAEAQYIGWGLGPQIGYQGYSEIKEEIWPAGHITFEAIEYLFGVLY